MKRLVDVGALVGAVLALVSAVGCTRPFTAHTPSAFVELKKQDPGYDYRAATPEGVVLAVRAIKNEPKGDLGFWTKAITLQLRQLGGYAHLSTVARSCRTLAGTQLRFGHDQGMQPHLYTLTVFVSDDWIYILEAGGRRALVEKLDQAIEKWVANFDPSSRSRRP